jgi:type IX secretion system PorP/SprF family membrane protein
MSYSYVIPSVKSVKKLFFVLVFLLPARIMFAQDFHLSQHDAPPMFLNPAMTGMFDGPYRIHAQYRNQWKALVTKPFTTAVISADLSYRKWGIGLQIMNYRAGLGNYNALSVAASVARDWTVDHEKNHHVAVGIQAGMIQKSVDVTKLIFGNQFVPVDGGRFDTGISNGELFSNYNFIIHDINAGLLYYFAKPNVRLNPFIGFSAFHITRPRETFFADDNKLPIRYYLHGGTKVNINSKIQLLPKFIYMRQVNAQELTATVLLYYYLQESATFLIFGPTYRSKDAGIIEFGIKKGPYTSRISYDVNTSRLKDVSNYRGGFEISLTYIPQRSKPNPLANCPRL